MANKKGGQSRKHATFGGPNVALETNLKHIDYRLDDMQDDISPLPSSCALTKQGSDVYAATSTDHSNRQAPLSFGKSSNAFSYS